MKTAFDRITCDPKKMNGQPCVRGLRITVRRVLEALSVCPDRQELLKDYPDLEEEDIKQALAYAAACLDGEFQGLAEMERRAQKGSQKKFSAAMAKVANGTPMSGDELPSH